MAMKEVMEAPKMDNLFSATQIFPVVPDTLTVAKKGALKRGQLLTAAGAVVTAADDVYAVLAEDVDTTAAAKEAPVYLTGEFNANALITDGTLAVADCKAAARKIGIFIKENIPA